MKRVLLIVLTLMCTLAGYAQSVEFTADITEMMPVAYPPRLGLSGFSFTMRNDSAYLHMPYMGQVYNPTFDNEGLNFGEPCEKMSIKPTKKKDGKKIDFKISHGFVNYRFRITMWDNNSIDISMQPSNAQSCNYMGTWEAIDNNK